MDIQEIKKKKLEEEHQDDTGLDVGKASSIVNSNKIKGGDNIVEVGTQKREILSNGQRIMTFSLNPDTLQKLDTRNGKFRIYIDNDNFKGNDTFKRKFIEIDKNAISQIKPSEDGTIKLIAYEKIPGGDVNTKNEKEREIIIVKDTPDIRRELVEKHHEVKYKGEEDLYEKAKVMKTPITPTLNFSDIYKNMSETEKGEINKLNSSELKAKIEENRPELSKIDERYLDKLKVEITTPDKSLKMVDDNNQTHEVKYIGSNTDGWSKYQKKDGEEITLNPYDAQQKVRPFNNENLYKNSVRESIDNTGFSIKSETTSIKNETTTDITNRIVKDEQKFQTPKFKM